jgi:hypothetical protein
MSKQEIMDVIVGCAEKLKHVPTLAEVLEMTQVSHKQIRMHFGGYLSALLECNLEPRETGRGAKKIPLEKTVCRLGGRSPEAEKAAQQKRI